MMDCVETHLIPFAQKALAVLPRPSDEHNTIVTTSGGLSVTVIPTELPYVLQIYVSDRTYDNVKRFWDQVTKFGGHAGLAQIYEFYDSLQMIKVQKVMPLNKYGVHITEIQSVGNLQKDISEVLTFLHEHNLSQGDTRLDNIGMVADKYVLFDYDKARCGQQKDADWHAFRQSLKFNARV